jgi:murein L,D-transpeptidase YcbB/YkuD
MKTQAVIFMVACGLVVCAAGCSKKTDSLEELQQPMSPEDLSRIQNQTAAGTERMFHLSERDSGAGEMSLSGEMSGDAAVEPLPPSGPYKPGAKDIQTALKAAGYYNSAIDGKIGPKTKKAIEEFQYANGLAADGKVGPKTWRILSRYLPDGVNELSAQGDVFAD